MHLRQVERNVRLQGAVKLHKFIHQRCVIEVLKTTTHKFAFCLDAGIFVEAVIAAEIVFIEQQVHLPTALAAKVFLVTGYNFCTRVTAVVTGWCSRFCCFFDSAKFSRKTIRLPPWAP